MLKRAMYNLYEWIVAGIAAVALLTTLYGLGNLYITLSGMLMF